MLQQASLPEGMDRSKMSDIASEKQPEGNRKSWLHSPFVFASLGNLLYWLALPPMGTLAFGSFNLPLWPLAWLAPIFWVHLTRLEMLPGKRPYFQLYLAGFLFWLVELYWLAMPHWAAGIGGVVLSLYFAVYLPLFVALVRIARSQFKVSVVIAAPIVWTGLELARAHVISGFIVSALGHTQYQWLMLIQISDLAGAYAVSFLVMLVAACVSRMMAIKKNSEKNSGKNAENNIEKNTRTYWPLIPMVAGLAATLIYGQIRLSQTQTAPGAKIALIQGAIDTQFDMSPQEQILMREKNRIQYLDQSTDLVSKQTDIDLIVWPESMYFFPYYELTKEGRNQNNYNQPEALTKIIEEEKIWKMRMESLGEILKCPIMVGCNVEEYSGPKPDFYVSSIFVDRVEQDGKVQSVVAGRYDKMHLVMFGEYVPLGEWMPWLYDLTPLESGTKPGKQPVAHQIGKDKSVKVAPHICFETFLPHVIRSQIITLREQGKEPDILISQTNDGWFWGSSLLDLQLISTVFRAVECRKPILTAANTGLSSWIDANGKVIECSPRREPFVIVANVQKDERDSLYLRIGDIPAGLCLLACCLIAVVGIGKKIRGR